jgi:hypothetical protein
MKGSTTRWLALTWCAIVGACSSHVPLGAVQEDAGSGAGGASTGGSTGGNAGTSTGASSGVGGNGNGAAGGGNIPDANDTGGTGGVAGDAGTSGTAGLGGSGGTAGLGGCGGVCGARGAVGTGGASGSAGTGGKGGTAGVSDAGGQCAGAAGSNGPIADGSTVACAVDQDCPAAPCTTPPRPESLCVFGQGAHSCVTRVHPQLVSPDAGGGSLCYDDAECVEQPKGHCIPYDYYYCSESLQLPLPPPPPGNRCVYDACSSDSDCTDQLNGFCTAGFPRVCHYGPCRTNADCNRKAGGRCVMELVDGWCSRKMVFCRYADDVCQSSAECGGGMFCVPNDDQQGVKCIPSGPPPP